MYACKFLHIGMSEACGLITTNLIKPGEWKLGTVGHPFIGIEVKLANTNEQGEGEVIDK